MTVAAHEVHNQSGELIGWVRETEHSWEMRRLGDPEEHWSDYLYPATRTDLESLLRQLDLRSRQH